MHTTDTEKSYIRQLVITYRGMERIKTLTFRLGIYLYD
ncbi:hypothetical protein SAMN05216464_10386 [Mucilaginibacter pineti]|uniref:Uncharacterized protein n=1 Tax=Mucilaginibacter pineti TaxID=1391627 RepID=A0A1G6YV94_9SPHI|nr:hypothetical protein SAMN05216464_10386 [Mucilaginibacter pineti]